ncbi:hypothetical protein BJV82DRAFT_577509 [Fennellomyces sp. T-0311]|nr:hypothetical protein BJV82DRAFT_577509 [Fennellomyces sp. T-0311]
MPIGHSKPDQNGDEEKLISSATANYGAVHSSSNSTKSTKSRVAHLQDKDACSSRGSSDAEDNCRDPRGTIAQRKRRRMRRHHHAGSSAKLLPRLMRRKHSKKSNPGSSTSSTTGSDHEGGSTTSDDHSDHDSDDALSRIDTADLVLPALDPK